MYFDITTIIHLWLYQHNIYTCIYKTVVKTINYNLTKYLDSS